MSNHQSTPQLALGMILFPVLTNLTEEVKAPTRTKEELQAWKERIQSTLAMLVEKPYLAKSIQRWDLSDNVLRSFVVEFLVQEHLKNRQHLYLDMEDFIAPEWREKVYREVEDGFWAEKQKLFI